ncbi:fibronectin type III domain-containing protein [Epilithonimonas sp. JDS]|uniref:fibronectin type III domain-containing protein n=1 Tax=Epilithonimonas sp. JDS TaxID=2902797 RepID=UPI001E591B96|nr:fibronectin type III domain-containing protein [Epilithonimonas sp. JDS]MCD9853447.1 fibronectin type III domain-containing protein [Epilithonimonas sp. JDS]
MIKNLLSSQTRNAFYFANFKFFVFLLVAFSTSLGLNGQVSLYNFTQSSETYTPLNPTTATTLVRNTGVGTSGADDVNYSATLPFSFTLGTTTQSASTTVYVNSNGFLSFGTPTASATTPISTATGNAVVAAIGRDLVNNNFAVTASIASGSNSITVSSTATAAALQVGEPLTGTGIPANTYITAISGTTITLSANATASNAAASLTAGGTISYSTVGSDFVVQFQNWAVYNNYGINSGLNFQIRLTQTTNVVRVVYGTNTTTSSNTTYPQVGLRGATNSIFNNRSGSTWAGTVSGSSNTATITLNSTSVPASGLTFIWSPPTCSGVPTALTSSLLTTNSATISWTAPSTAPASGYEYYYSTSSTTPTSSQTPSGSTAAGVTTAGLSSLLPATTYYYWVRSNCNGTDKSAWSASGTFTTACSIPNAPSNVVISNVTATTLTVGFTAASPVPTGYMVFLSTTTTDIPTLSSGTTYVTGTDYVIGGKTYKCVVSNGTVTSYDLVGGTPNTQHNYFVFSRSSTNSCAGAPWYSTGVTGSATTCLATPTSSAGTAVTSSGFTANWAAVTGATGYLLDVSTVSTFASFVSGYNGLAVTGTSQAVTGLNPATSYYYRVRATGATSCTSVNSATQTVLTSCNAISSFPWTENFDSMSTIGSGVAPTCWSNVTGTKAWVSANAATDTYNDPRSTPNYMSIQYSNSLASQLWTPAFALSAGTSYDISFYYNTGTGTTNTGWTGKLLVNNSQILTGATELATFVSATQTTSGYVKYTYSYTPASAANYTFAVSVSSTGTPWNLGVDDFRLELTPTCQVPVAPFSSAMVAVNNANINWTAPSAAPTNGYEYYLSTTNTAPTAGSTITGSVGAGITTASITTGLVEGNTYYWWVRSNCNGVDKSTWASGGSFYYGYCRPSSTNTTNYISNFTTTKGYTSNISNTSTYTTGGYQDNYATQKVEMYAAGTVDFSFTSTGGSAGTAIWIDWNNNLVFESSERVYGLASYVTSGSGSITVPAGTAVGDYRMRVRTMYLSNGNVVDPCNSSITRSEAEDYKFTVVATPDYTVYTDAVSPNNTVNNTIDVYLKDFDGVNNFYTDGQTSIWMYAGVQVSPTSQFQYIGTTAQDANNTATLVEFTRQSTSPNVYKATIKFADYFCIPAGTTVQGINLIFRNQYSALGNDKTADLFLDLGDATVVVNVPTLTAAASITDASATINWTAPTSGAIKGYDYYYSNSSTAPITSTTPSGTTAAGVTTANLTALNPSTLYYVWVRTKGCGADVSAWSTVGTFTTAHIAAVLDYADGFEGANNWTLVNGTQTNKWFVGNAVNNGGTKSLYISSTATGTNNNYISTTSVVQAYRDIAITSGTTLVDINYDWRAVGENIGATYYDYFKVWLVPASFTPVAGTQITAGAGRVLLNDNMNQQPTFATKFNTNVDVSSFAGQTMRLVFEWNNDNFDNYNTAAAIDNVEVKKSCAVSITSVTNGSNCGTGSVNLSAVGSAGTTEYRWYSASTGGTPLATTPIGNWSTPSISETTTYYVSVFNGTCESGLRSSVVAAILVAPANIVLEPTIVSSPAGATDVACALDYVKLDVTGNTAVSLIKEGFETAVSDYFSLNATGSGSFYTEPYFTEGTQAISLEGAGVVDNAAGNTRIVLTNSIDLSQYASAQLTFDHICASEAGFDYGYVEYSTNGGTNWTTFPTSSYVGTATLKNGVVSFDKSSYSQWNTQFTTSTSTPGTAPASAMFRSETINLASFMGNTNFKIRFRLAYDNVVDYYGWIIDNVKINVTPKITWTPSTGLYTDAALTIPYVAAANATTVYAAPTIATSYQLKATVGTCDKIINTASVERLKKEFRGPGTDWNTAANWFPAQVPDNGKCASIPATQTVVINSNAEAKSLTIAATGKTTITAGNSLTVTDAIDITNNATNDNLVLESDANLLQVNSTIPNTGKMLAKRDVKMRRLDYTYWSSPVKDQPLLNTANVNAANSTGGFSEGSPNNRIFQYNESDDRFYATPDAKFIDAKGYAIRGKSTYDPAVLTSDTNLKFVGTPNNGSYSINIKKSPNTGTGGIVEHGYNLIGNPYPSNMDFVKFFFLGNNSNIINAKAWFWSNVTPVVKQDGSAYAGNNYATITLLGGTPPTTTVTPSPSTGAYIPTKNIKVGQAFIVQAKNIGTNQTLTYDNTIRTGEAGVFYNNKGTSDVNRYWVMLTTPDNIVNTILIGHVDGATNNYDANYDADILSLGDDSFYSKLNTQKLQIQARSNPLNLEDVIPLGNKYSVTGNYKISLGSKEGIFDTNQKIYLFDKLNNLYTDLTSQDYIFTANKGTDETRFEIVYKNKEVLASDDLKKSEFLVYRDGEYFVVKSSKILGNVELYDASGKLIVSKSTSQKELRLDARTIVSGVYIIKADNAGNIRTKKIIK